MNNNETKKVSNDEKDYNNFTDNIIQNYFDSVKDFELTPEFFSNLEKELKRADDKLNNKITITNELIEFNRKEIKMNKEIYTDKLDQITMLFNNYEYRISSINNHYSQKLGYVNSLSKTLTEYENLNNNIDYADQILMNLNKLNSEVDYIPTVFKDKELALSRGVELYEAYKSLQDSVKKDYPVFIKNFKVIETKIQDIINQSIKEFYENNETTKLEKLFSQVEKSSSDFIIETYCNYILMTRRKLGFMIKSMQNLDFVNLDKEGIKKVEENLVEFNKEILEECIIQFGKASSKIFLLFPESRYQMVIPIFVNKVFKLIEEMRSLIIEDRSPMVKALMLARLDNESNEITASNRILSNNNLATISNSYENEVVKYNKIFLQIILISHTTAINLVDQFKPLFEFLNSTYSPVKIELGLLYKFEHETNLFTRTIEGIYMTKEKENYETMFHYMTEDKYSAIGKLKMEYNDFMRLADREPIKSLSEKIGYLQDFQEKVFSLINSTSFSFLSRDSEAILTRISKIISNSEEKTDFAASFVLNLYDSMKNLEEFYCRTLENIIIEVQRLGERLQDMHYFCFSRINYQVNEIKDIFLRHLRGILKTLNFYDEVEESISKKAMKLSKKVDDVFERIEITICGVLNDIMKNISSKNVYNIKKKPTSIEPSKEIIFLIDSIEPLFTDVIFSWPENYQNKISTLITKMVYDKFLELLRSGVISEYGAKIMKVDFNKVFMFFDSKFSKDYSNLIFNALTLVDIFLITSDAIDAHIEDLLNEKDSFGKQKFDEDLIKLLVKKRKSFNY